MTIMKSLSEKKETLFSPHTLHHRLRENVHKMMLLHNDQPPKSLHFWHINGGHSQFKQVAHLSSREEKKEKLLDEQKLTFYTENVMASVLSTLFHTGSTTQPA